MGYMFGFNESTPENTWSMSNNGIKIVPSKKSFFQNHILPDFSKKVVHRIKLVFKRFVVMTFPQSKLITLYDNTT